MCVAVSPNDPVMVLWKVFFSALQAWGYCLGHYEGRDQQYIV